MLKDNIVAVVCVLAIEGNLNYNVSVVPDFKLHVAETSLVRDAHCGGVETLKLL